TPAFATTQEGYGLYSDAQTFQLESALNRVHGNGGSESQTFAFTVVPTTGNYRLAFPDALSASNITPDIPHDATAAVIQDALEHLPYIGEGNVTVTGGGATHANIVVSFTRALSRTNVPTISVQ